MAIFSGEYGTGTTTKYSDLPDWVKEGAFQNYQLANQITSQPAPIFPGPRVAPFSPDQLASFDMVRNNVGIGTPYIGAANNMLGGAQGYFGQGAGMIGGAQNDLSAATGQVGTANSTMAGAFPYFGQAGGTYNTALSGLNNAKGDVNTGRNTMQGAFPYFDEASGTYKVALQGFNNAGNTYGQALGQTDTAGNTLGDVTGDLASAGQQAGYGGGQIAPEDINRFLNPFESQVVDRVVAEINRQADIRRREIGQQTNAYGGARHGVAEGMLDRSTTGAVADQIAQLMYGGWNTALGAAQEERARALASGGLYNSIGQTRIGQGTAESNLANTIANIAAGQGNLASQRANVGQMQADLGTRTANVGAQQANLANILGNLEAIRANIGTRQADLGTRTANVGAQQGQLASILNNIGATRANLGSQLANVGAQQANAATIQAQLGEMLQSMGLRDTAALQSIGQAQQDQVQRNFDTAYQDWQGQVQWPFEMLNYRMNALSGSPYQTSTSTVSPLEMPDPFSQGVGTLATLYGLFNNQAQQTS